MMMNQALKFFYQIDKTDLKNLYFMWKPKVEFMNLNERNYFFSLKKNVEN